MFTHIDTKQPTEVEIEVQKLYQAMFPGADRYLIARAFNWATDCFTGNYKNYQPIDAKYHDFEHTLQGTLCLVRIMHNWKAAKATPDINLKMFELALLAILLHDTGYLKIQGDNEGTGAKYTLVHVNRSAEFAATLLSENGFSRQDTQAVQNMIRCTGVNVDLKAIPFSSELERNLGFSLSTADLLGQMAADDYVDKLPILYQEFEESAHFNSSGKGTAVGMFSSAEDLMRKTPMFYEKFVLNKIQKDFLGLYRFLNVPYPDGPNHYLLKIEQNLQKLQTVLAALPPV